MVCAAGSTEQHEECHTEQQDEKTPSKGVSDSGSSSPKERKYQCMVCNKRFTRPSSLACHRRTHTGEKPHVCMFPGCGKQFSVQSNLRRHMRIHEKTLLPSPMASGSITASSTPLMEAALPRKLPASASSAAVSSSRAGSGKTKRKAKDAKPSSRKHRQVPSNGPPPPPAMAADACGLPKPLCTPAASMGSLQPMAAAGGASAEALVLSNAMASAHQTPWPTLLPMHPHSSAATTPPMPSTANTLTLDLYQANPPHQTCGPMTAPIMHPGFGSVLSMRSMGSANLGIPADDCSRSSSENPHEIRTLFCGGPPMAGGIHPLQYQSYPFSAQPGAVFALASPTATEHHPPPPLPSLLLAPCTPTMPLSAAAAPYSALYAQGQPPPTPLQLQQQQHHLQQQQQQQMPAVAAHMPELPYSAFGFF
ncbi:hypothetical protein EV175_003096 [Coemansia sp. RSA 1933]|nr:hypothetical protein EV175_003096 [Coemansia sp. RSA 1933]